MHIKNIVISGFRSYRDQSFQDELSPRHNVIVGRNGSGKSNFFAAVQFVLSEKFANLRPDERKELFHVGAGRPVLAVFVEIVFDNSDGRIVIPGAAEEAEVRIRRTVGLKQDEFRVNDRRFTHTEIRQLLESAGFSSSNPYYIVEQGKIVNLANMMESERYQLIKDVAGTKVYEARRAESETILDESKGRIEKVDESIKQLLDRLLVLESETSELRAFQEADKKRKAVEYCIYNSELTSVKNELEKVELDWNSRTSIAAPHEDNEELIHKEERLLINCHKNLETLERDRKSLDRERSELASRRALAQLKVDDAIAIASKDAAEVSDLRGQEKDVRKALDKTAKDCSTKNDLVCQASKQSEDLQVILEQKSARLEVLQAKKGRKNQFKTKTERDSWIQEEVKRNRDVEKSNSQEIARLTSEIEQLELERQRDASDAKAQTKALQQNEVALSSVESKKSSLISERDKLNIERRKLWSAVQEKEAVVRRLTNEFEASRHQMERLVKLEIRQGLNSLEESLKEINDERLKSAVHGQVINLMSVDRGFELAVDVTAGNTLFNVVVDSFEVSTRLLDHMNRKKKPGRISFFPLDTCKSTARNIPTTAACSSLLSHISFDQRFRSVFAEIFGKTAVVKTLEIGAQVSREQDVDAITMEGDQFNRKGGVTGGHVERRSTRVSANAGLKTTLTNLDQEKRLLSEILQQVANVEQSVTSVLHQIEQQDSQENTDRQTAEIARFDVRSYEDRCHRLAEVLHQKQRSREALIKSNSALQKSNGQLLAELSTDFKAVLTTQEEIELEALQQEVTSMRSSAAAIQARIVQLSTEHELLRGQLHYFDANLATIRDRLSRLGRSARTDGSLVKEVASIDEEIRVVDERISLIEQEIEKLATERKVREDVIAGLRDRHFADAKAQQEDKDAIDRSHNQRVLLLQRKEDVQSKMRKVGIVSQEELDRYSTFSTGKLMHVLKGVQEEMKKFAHVNKKAVDQYTSLVETRNELLQQKDALAKEWQSIIDLIKHLDEKKDEAIQRTYKQVQYNFEKVFQELVNAEGATAELQLVKNSDRTDKDPYSAVRVKVTFGIGNPVTELAQLSGGQKSLVALALIFAIQRCDPAPFYLFDEIDAALDAEYRTAVANVLRKQSDGCQFITATFKTEMLEAADKVLGIFFHNKISRIQPISKEEGLKLLKQAAMDERKRSRDDESQ